MKYPTFTKPIDIACKLMTDTQINDMVILATKSVLQNDLWLLKNNTSEQSISHKIAFYLQPLFKDFDVDCEYNRDVDRANNKKVISVLKKNLQQIGLLRNNEADDLERELTNRAVFPDIIIHKRGTNKKNLCIIEVKKSTSNVTYDYDFIKLISYTSNEYNNNLKYQIGIFIEAVIDGNNSKFSFIYFKDGRRLASVA